MLMLASKCGMAADALPSRLTACCILEHSETVVSYSHNLRQRDHSVCAHLTCMASLVGRGPSNTLDDIIVYGAPNNSGCGIGEAIHVVVGLGRRHM